MKQPGLICTLNNEVVVKAVVDSDLI